MLDRQIYYNNGKSKKKPVLEGKRAFITGRRCKKINTIIVIKNKEGK